MKNLLAFFLGWLIAAAVLLPQAHAAVTATPLVQGYSASSGRFASAAGSFSMTAANDGFIKPSVVNVGGRAVTMPATLRMAANAGQIAKTAMRLNPWLIAGTLAAGWLLDQDIQPDGSGGYIITVSPDCLGQTIGAAGGVYSNCYRHPDSDAWWNGQAPSPVCPAPYQTFDHGGFTPSYRYCGLIVPAGTSTRPATPEDFEALPDPLPAIAPELPYAPYLPEGVPVTSPEYAPQTVPVGDPYTKPDGSTVQPMAKISPASDGQVTIDTYDQPLTDPQGNPVPDPQPQDTLEPQPTDCDKLPNSVGCTDLGTPPAGEDMPRNEIPITFTPVSIPADATCPAPITVAAFGQSIEVDYSGACTFASGLKPVVIAIGYLTALFIIFGVPRSAQS